MASLGRRFRLALVLLLLACPADSSDDTGGGSTTMADATGATAATMSTSASTSMTDASTGATEGATGATTAEATTASNDTGPADSGSSTGGDACDPHGGDDACVTCTKTMCCGQIHGCTSNPDCACVYQCLSGISAPDVSDEMDCAGPDNCNVDFLAISALLQQIDACRTGLCADDCK